MDMKTALEKVSEIMKLAAQHAKDKGAIAWSAEAHATAAGYCLRVVFQPKDGQGLEPTAANYAGMFHALYNHSAWRQKFEKAGIFAKQGERSLAGLVGELEEEFGE